jgi:hypothetical protein
MNLQCQACSARFSFGEFATLPDVCHSCQRVGRQPSDRTKALVDARGERNVGRLMAATGVIVSTIALVFDANPDAALLSKWKVGFAGLAVLGGGLAKIRHANRRLKKLERDPP